MFEGDEEIVENAIDMLEFLYPKALETGVLKPYGGYDPQYKRTRRLEEALMTLSMYLNSGGQEEGSYAHSWQSNIACKIMDNSDIEHEQANDLAKKILEIFKER